ncbi:MAG: hypothetical protein N2255_09440 [Kiritimatiellae bacterium]|nr:hypothetical protein [Kiritimatiellia bacterium]
MAARRLLLVDGTAVLYRAFYAIPELSTRSGRPTNAVYGFIRMLRQTLDHWNPSHVAVAFDGGLPQERVELAADYKAQRPPMPDKLREQIPMVEEYLDRANTAWVRREGVEADDMIASIVMWAQPAAEEILIVSSDKDMYQLVNDSVRIVPLSGKKDVIGPQEVRAKTGVSPNQIVEWLALVGDASDNISGVEGIGPKGAARLLLETGSLDHVWGQPECIRNEKLRVALLANRELVERNVAMIRLRTDLPVPFDWQQMEVKPPDTGRLLAFFDKLEFGSLAKALRERRLL